MLTVDDQSLSIVWYWKGPPNESLVVTSPEQAIPFITVETRFYYRHTLDAENHFHWLIMGFTAILKPLDFKHHSFTPHALDIPILGYH